MKRVAPTGCSLTQKSSLNLQRLSKVEYIVWHLNLNVNNGKIVVMRLAKPCRRLCILLATHSQFKCVTDSLEFRKTIKVSLPSATYPNWDKKLTTSTEATISRTV